jgi:hypothetical protein
MRQKARLWIDIKPIHFLLVEICTWVSRWCAMFLSIKPKKFTRQVVAVPLLLNQIQLILVKIDFIDLSADSNGESDQICSTVRLTPYIYTTN